MQEKGKHHPLKPPPSTSPTTNMQEKGSPNDGFGPLGICHRLFNFIMNTFLTRGTRCVTFSTTNAASASDGGSRALEGKSDQDQVIKPNGRDTSPEILVEFRHTNGATVNRSGNTNTSNQVLIQGNVNTTQTHQKTESQDQGNANGGGEKVKKKSTLIIEDGGNLPGRRHHLLSVTSNINEKADAFIRSRKEAMEKNLSLKQTTDA